MTIEAVVAAPEATVADAVESIQAGYDRIANPEKVQEEKQKEADVELATETPPEIDPLADIRSEMARIPDVLKQLNDVNGRYGRLTQRFEELQKRIAAPTHGATTESAVADVEDMLKGIKDEFGEDGLYTSLKSAFSKLAAGKSIDPGAIEKMVTEKIAATKQAETETAMNLLTEAHPTWQEDRETPEFKAWMESLPVKERKRFERSEDPFYVADKLDDFKAWKEKKAAPTPKEDTPTPVVAPKTEHAPSKRLTNAVLPTTGAKPKTAGEDDKASSIRAGYERVAGARMR